MLLSIVIHGLAAIAVTIMCGLALHFILLVSLTAGYLIGLVLYLLIILSTSLRSNADTDN
jgi:hypothetical protein